MSTTIDQKVVEMRFDNSNFENNVKTSMSTLDKLKKALKFDGASKGLEDVQKCANKVNFSGMSRSVDAMTQKFSYMQMTIQHQLNNIVDSAVNAGKRMVSALTIDPVKSGFQEYETQINAVQTILANTSHNGTTLEEVNNALDTLNTYADKTIYNFTEMTRNIGTFTAAGIDLQTSVDSIQGIANLAAVSGSTSQQASTAMYQLSQALAAGKVSLMDWNSVVNAGMGGKVFQDALVRTSELLKTGAKDAIATSGSFRESLTKTGWLTTEVLTETLKQFAGAYSEADLIAQGFTKEQAKEIANMAVTAEDAATKVKTFTQLWDTLKEAAQSGWTQSWEIIIGDFEEAKALFTEISDFVGDIINKVSNRRNSILEGALGGNPFGKLGEKIDKITGPIERVTNATEKVTDATKKYEEVVNRVIYGEFGNGQERYDKLTEAGYDWAHVQNLVNEKLGDSTRYATDYKESQDELNKTQQTTIDDLVKMSDAQLKNLGFTKGEIEAFRELQKQSEKTGIPIKDLIKDMDQLNGRTLLINSFKNIGKALVDTFSAIGKAWKEIFWGNASEEDIIAQKTETLYNIVAAFHKFTTYLTVNEEVADKITRTFKGVFAILDVISTLAGGALKTGFKVLSAILGAFDLDILDVTASIGDLLVKFRDWILQDNLIAKTINNLISKLPDAISKFKEWFNIFKETPAVKKIIDLFEKLREQFSQLTNLEFGSDAFIDLGQKIVANIKKIPGLMIQCGKDIIAGLRNGLGDGIGDVVGKISEVATNIISTFCAILGIHSPSTVAFGWGKYIIMGLVAGLLAYVGLTTEAGQTIVDKIKEIFSGLKDTKLGEVLSSIFGNINWDGIFAFVKDLQAQAAKVDWGKVLLGAISTGLFVTLNKILDVVKNITEPLSGIGALFETFSDSMEKIGKAQAKNLNREALLKTALAIGVLVAAISLLVYVAGDNYAQIWNAVGVIAAIAGVLVVLSVFMDKMGAAAVDISKDGIKIDGLKKGLASIGIAIVLMAVAVKLISGLDPEAAKQGFIGLAEIMVSILAFMGVSALIAKKGGDIKSFGKTMKQMAVAMLLMLAVIKIASMMDPADIIIGMVVIEAFVLIALQMAIANRIAGGNAVKFGKTMRQMATSMLLMLGVIYVISLMDPADIITGLIVIEAFTLIMLQIGIINRVAGSQVSKFGGTMLKMTFSMLLLVGVIKLISMLELETVVEGVLVMQAFVLLIGEMLVVAKIGKNIDGAASAIVSMAIAIGIMAGVSILLSAIDLPSLIKGVAAVSVLGLVMAAMLKFASGLSVPEKGKTGMGSIIAMTVAVAVMAAAVAALSYIPVEKLLGATATLILLLRSLVKTIQIIGDQKIDIKSVIPTLLTMVVVVGLISVIIEHLAKNIEPKNAITATGVLSAVMIALAGTLKVIGNTKINARSIIPTLGAMIVAAGSMAVIIGLLSKYSSAGNLIGTAFALSEIMLALGLTLAVIDDIKVNPKSLIPTLGAMVVAVGLLAVILGLLANNTDCGTALVTALSLSAVMLAFGVMTAIISGINVNVKSLIPTLAIMVVATGLLATILYLLADNTNCAEALAVAVAISAVLVAFAVATGILSVVGAGAASAAAGALGMVGVIVAVGVLLAALGWLSENIPKAKEFMDAGIPILESIGTGLGRAIGGFIGGLGSGFAEQLASMGESIKSFANSFSEINSGAVEGALSFAGLIAALGGASILEALGNVIGLGQTSPIETFKKYAIGMVDAVVEITSKLDGVTVDTATIEKVTEAGSLFVELNKSLPKNGGIAQDIAGEQDLSKFAGSCVAFAACMISINNAVSVEGFDVNTEMIGKLVSAGERFNDLNTALPKTGGIAQDLAGEEDLEKFGASCSAFAKCMIEINSSLGENFTFNSEAISKMSEAGLAINDLNTALPKTGGIAQDLAGEEDLSKFSLSCVAFVACMKSINQSLGEDFTMNTDAIDSMKTAGEKINDLQSTLPKSGGWWQDIAGEQDISDFGSKVEAFGTAMKNFATSIGDGISEDAVTSVKTASEIMVALEETLPKDTGGWWIFSSDDTTLTDFGDNLQAFGEAFSKFNEGISGVDSSAIDTALNMCDRIKVLINSIADLDTSGVTTFTGVGTGGVGADGVAYKIAQAMKAFSDKVAGIDTAAVSTASTAALKIKTLIAGLAGLDTSGVELFKPESIGKAMKAYAEKVAGIDTGVVSSSIASANRLRNFISSLSGLDSSGVSNFKPGSIGTALNTYSSNVSGIDLAAITNSISAGNKMKSFISSLAGLDTTGVSSFKTAISDLASVNISKAAKSLNSTSDLSSAGAKMMKSMSQGISTNASSVNTSVTKTLTSMMKNINSKADDFKRAGAKLMAGIASGLSSKADSVSTATKKAAADGASAIRNKYNSFYENGKYLGAGLVAGINAKQQSAWDAGYALGRAAVEGEKAGQQSNSPSKLTIKAGKWLGEGLVIGMERMARTVYKAGYGLGDSAVGSISSTIAKISDYVNEGVDAEPTIRPVLDLSDVKSGVNSIGNMLDMNSSIGVMSNVGAISTMMNNRSQNGANDDVISAINKLSKQLGNTGGNTYNINGVTYDDGSNVSNAVESLIRAARVERRI